MRVLDCAAQAAQLRGVGAPPPRTRGGAMLVQLPERGPRRRLLRPRTGGERAWALKKRGDPHVELPGPQLRKRAMALLTGFFSKYDATAAALETDAGGGALAPTRVGASRIDPAERTARARGGASRLVRHARAGGDPHRLRRAADRRHGLRGVGEDREEEETYSLSLI